MNTCQALVKPHCTKPAIQKSRTIKIALANLLDTIPNTSGLLHENVDSLPENVKKCTKFVTLEFAGVKFKTRAVTGIEYLQTVNCDVFGRLFKHFPHVSKVVVCEEKYKYTPENSDF